MKMFPVFLCAMALAGCAAAQTAEIDPVGEIAPLQEDAASPPTKPAPPCQSAVYHEFDFWIGEWNVYDANGELAGTNSIQPEEGGCVLVERWQNTGGGTGQSYNFYDPGVQKWRQVWVSKGLVIDYAGGLTDTGSMLLKGEARYHAGAVAPFTGEWTLNSDGSVTQHFMQQETDTGEWTDWFFGKYVRKADDPDSAN